MSILVSKKVLKNILKKITKYLTTQKVCGRILIRLNKTNKNDTNHKTRRSTILIKTKTEPVPVSKSKLETQQRKDISRKETNSFMADVNTMIDLKSPEVNTHQTNLYGETDIPEAKWLTNAKKQVLNNQENNKFKDEVTEGLNDIFRGWTTSTQELKASFDTIQYIMSKINENNQVSKDDYVQFLVHRIVVIALTSRLNLRDPSKIILPKDGD